MATRMALTLLVVGLWGSTPSSLVQRLGAPRYADREAASAALEKLGHDALPALRAARSARDPEVRSRAEGLVRRIENDLLVSPTLVTLDFRDRPLSEVVAEIGERGHARMELKTGDPTIASRRIDLLEAEPVPLWSAIDHLNRLAHLEMSNGSPVNGFGPRSDHADSCQLFPIGEGRSPAPTSVSGPFRSTLLNISYHKERLYGPVSGTAPGMIPFPVAARRPGRAEFPAAIPQPVSEQFFANLQVVAEPRISIAMNGPLQVSEATDDRGHSLLHPSSQPRPVMHNSGYDRVDLVGSGALQVTIPLQYPAAPGHWIRRLNVTVPLVVSARKEEPLTIPLAEAPGKSYARPGVTLTIREAHLDPTTGQATIDLTIRSADSEAINPGMMLGEGIELRVPGHHQNPVEFADALGHVYRNWGSSSQSVGPEGLRLTVKLRPGEGIGPVSEIRYYEIARVSTEARFEFRDVPMP